MQFCWFFLLLLAILGASAQDNGGKAASGRSRRGVTTHGEPEGEKLTFSGPQKTRAEAAQEREVVVSESLDSAVDLMQSMVVKTDPEKRYFLSASKEDDEIQKKIDTTDAYSKKLEALNKS